MLLLSFFFFFLGKSIVSVANSTPLKANSGLKIGHLSGDVISTREEMQETADRINIWVLIEDIVATTRRKANKQKDLKLENWAEIQTRLIRKQSAAEKNSQFQSVWLCSEIF